MKRLRKNLRFDFPNANDWKKIKHSSIMDRKIIYVPLVIFSQLAIYKLSLKLFHITPKRAENILPELIYLSLIAIIMVIIHELIHLLILPCSIISDLIYVGIYWVLGVVPTFGVLYTGEMTRRRKQVVMIMPFCVLTVIPTIFMLATQFCPKLLYVIVVLNAMGCLNDIIIFLNLFSIPAKSTIWMGYWHE